MFPPEKQTSIGLIVGLGAAASAALAAFYVLYKKDDDTFELDPRLKLTSSSDHAIRSTTIHKTIPKKIAGAVIGRGGEVIRRVQADTNTKIKTCDQPDGTRIMSITGSPSGVLEADEAIDAIIESFLSNVKRKIYIDANEVGLVIGKGGANIRLISEESGARVNIPRNVVNASGRVPVEVRGEVTMVEKAIAMIDEKLRSKVVKDWSSEPIRTSYPFIPSHYNVYTLTTLLMFEKFEPDVDNDFVDTFVSSVQNPSKFYLQICVPNGNDLDRFMVEMTDYYEEAENRSRAKLTSIVEGDIVAAKFMDDEHYYRVKIVSIEDTPNITDETEISVFNLDFGNEAIVKKRDLFILHEDFLFRLPFQAVECSLSGVSPISDSGWSEGAIDHFKKISRATLWEKILARPVQATDVDKERRQKFAVELILHQDGISLNIAQDLIEKGFAIALTS